MSNRGCFFHISPSRSGTDTYSNLNPPVCDRLPESTLEILPCDNPRLFAANLVDAYTIPVSTHLIGFDCAPAWDFRFLLFAYDARIFSDGVAQRKLSNLLFDLFISTWSTCAFRSVLSRKVSAIKR